MSVARLQSEIQDLDLFVSLASEGLATGADAISLLDLRRETASVLGRPDPFPDADSYQAARQSAERIEAFGSAQRDKGYPYLYELATVKLWSLLENCVDEIVVTALDDPAKCPDQDLVRSIKGPLLEFLEASEDQRSEFLAGELKQLTRSRLQTGVGAFEAILRPVGLGGRVDPDVRRTLLELGQVRHLLVHRLGIVDARFADTCPWLAVALKDRLVIHRDHYDTYVMGCHWYLIELDRRQTLRDDQTPLPRSEKVQEQLVSRIKASQEPDAGTQRG